ncbi:MAG: ribosomal L7Ae/L30e/S12e/Gadd45 family protein [Synergistaceae bacterium]|jgi:ribosomal protein L7Ae-like RNA K-turn-binding protein|nr:ribosomal L7Ae/L30e/S12e/Gadd45 family protein [Synergistaceae bacterium]
MTPEAAGRILSLLGLARRARQLVMGQDRIFGALKSGQKLRAIASEDCSQNVLRKAKSAKCDVTVIPGLSRESLGAAVGIGSAMIVALPSESGFTRKISDLSK